MIRNFNNWGNQPLNKRLLHFLCFIAAGCWFAANLSTWCYDTDMLFLIATGREIVKNGIPKTNVWSIDSGLGFIAQQWLYDILMCGLDRLGLPGFVMFLELELLLLCVLCVLLFRAEGLPWEAGLLPVLASSVFCRAYLFTVRPQVITLLLLILECLGLEYYRKSKQKRWLLLVPLSMLLEMNLHGSMWPFHFCILLAFLIPPFWMPKKYRKCEEKIQRLPVFIAGLSMIPFMFLNPYGSDGVLYILKSWTAGTFRYANVPEMQAPSFLTSSGLAILILIGFLIYGILKGKVSGFAANLSAGFLFLSMAAVRNNMFLLIIIVFLIRLLTVR